MRIDCLISKTKNLSCLFRKGFLFFIKTSFLQFAQRNLKIQKFPAWCFVHSRLHEQARFCLCQGACAQVVHSADLRVLQRQTFRQANHLQQAKWML